MKSCLVNYALYLKNKFNISVSTLIVHTEYTWYRALCAVSLVRSFMYRLYDCMNTHTLTRRWNRLNNIYNSGQYNLYEKKSISHLLSFSFFTELKGLPICVYWDPDFCGLGSNLYIRIYNQEIWIVTPNFCIS